MDLDDALPVNNYCIYCVGSFEVDTFDIQLNFEKPKIK